MGLVVHRQAALYAQEYGWDDTFEALLAYIVAQFFRDYDHRHERCWLAERDGAIIGSVFGLRPCPGAYEMISNIVGRSTKPQAQPANANSRSRAPP